MTESRPLLVPTVTPLTPAAKAAYNWLCECADNALNLVRMPSLDETGLRQVAQEFSNVAAISCNPHLRHVLPSGRQDADYVLIWRVMGLWAALRSSGVAGNAITLGKISSGDTTLPSFSYSLDADGQELIYNAVYDAYLLLVWLSNKQPYGGGAPF